MRPRMARALSRAGTRFARNVTGHMPLATPRVPVEEEDQAPIETVVADVCPSTEPAEWTASVRTPHGDGVALHSRRNPLAEARKQLETVDHAAPPVVVLIGAGLGFLTEAARTRWPKAQMVVVEPVPQLASAAASRRPDLYRSDDVRVVVGPGYDGAEDLWRVFDDAASAEAGGPAVVVHPVMARVLPDAMAYAARVVRRAVRSAQMNARARQDNAGRYLLNTLRNLPLIARSADPSDLRRQFERVPAVIVGAGPSLDRDLPGLRALADRALIVSTDTAWHPLVAAGIDPHFVIAVDPIAANGRHLDGVPSRQDTWVIAEGSVDPPALRSLAGRIATFRVAAHHPWPWLQRLGVERPLIDVWGSVLTAAYSLATGFGCDPVIFVGADLAFPGERPYCRGTAFEGDWARYTAQGVSLREVWRNTLSARPVLTLSDADGEDVLTAPHLVEVRDWLLERAHESTQRVLNASSGGILHGPGVEQVTLASALDALPIQERAPRQAIRDVWCQRPDPSISDSLVQQLSELAGQSDRGGDEFTTAPLAEWLAFGAPSLTASEIRSAVVAAHGELSEPASSRGSVRSSSRQSFPRRSSRFYEADRVASMRALLTGDRSVLDGCEERAPDPDRCVASDGIALIDSLLSFGVLATGLTDAAGSLDNPLTLPLSHRFRWTAEAGPLVGALEECLLECLPNSQEWRASFQDHSDFWAGSVSPVLDGDDPPRVRQVNHEQAARLTLMAHRTALLPAPGASTTLDAARQQRLILAIERGVLDPRLSALPDVSYRLETFGSAVLPLRLDAFMRAITGTLAWTDTGTSDLTAPTPTGWPEVRVVSGPSASPVDPRLVLFAAGAGFVEPEVLTGSGLARGWVLATLEADEALFTPHLGSDSVRIDADGRTVAGSSWPIPITGEVPWGEKGGSLAWNLGDSTVLLRRCASGDPIVEKAPFDPAQVTVIPDGSVYWCAFGGGLWDWFPGQSGRLLADVPHGSLRFEDPDLVVAPIACDRDGNVTRRRLAGEWRYDTSSSRVRQAAIGREGQCGTVARRGDWTACTYPFSDLVRIERTGSRPLSLACYAPFGAAWAGGSLLITTGDGDVLLFRQLMQRMAAILGEGSGAPQE